MRYHCFIFLTFFLIFSNLFAQDKRPTSFSTSFTSGSSNYSETGARLAVGLNEDWLLVGTYSKTDENGFITNYFSAGFDLYATDKLSFSGDVSRSTNDDDLIGTGIAGGLVYDFNHHFNSKKVSTVIIDIGRTNYTQDALVSGMTTEHNDDDMTISSQKVKREYSQSFFGFGIDQEIIDSLSVGFYIKKYSYSDYTRASVTGRRGETFSTPGASTEYSIEQSSNIHMIISPQFISKGSLYLKMGNAKYKDGAKTDNYEVSPAYRFNNLSIGFSYAVSKTSGKEQTYFSPTLKYYF